jgi:hypothetical protein
MKKKLPECAQWALTRSDVQVRVRTTEWPFPVSIEAKGSVRITVPVAPRRDPLPYEPALF